MSREKRGEERRAREKPWRQDMRWRGKESWGQRAENRRDRRNGETRESSRRERRQRGEG